MRVLVTGGAGYVGAVTTRTLLDRGHDVVVLDDLSAGHRDAVAPEADFVHGNLGDLDALEEAGEGGIDACVHFAGRIEAGESMRRPEAFFAANTAATAHLLGWLLTRGVTRFVFSSTAAVYGDPTEVPIAESAQLRPTNAYGESKLMVERMLDWLGRLRGLRFAALRYFNASGAVAGLGERHDPETHLIPLVLDVAAGRRDHISVFGRDYPTADGTAVRDYVHVEDLARAHVLALDALVDHPALVCNLGTGRGHSVQEVVDAARRVTGHPIPVEDAPRRPGDPPALVADPTRARRLLDWEARHRDLEDIVGSAWDERCRRAAKDNA